MYLFVLVIEVLSFLIQKEAVCGRMEGVAITEGAPKITNLFFVDDSLLFGKVDRRDMNSLRSIIRKYGEASGHQINFEKSSMMFSSNTVEGDRRNFCAEMCVNEVPDLGRYLGLPTHVGRNRMVAFNKIKEKVCDVLNSW